MTNRNLPFKFDRKVTESKRHYELLCLKYCSPAKIIKEYLKPIFECVYTELEKNKIQKMLELEGKEFILENCDCVFNPVVYSEVLNLYLVYLSLYKKKGFTKDYLEQVILIDANHASILKLKFNFFDSREERWRQIIKLSSEDKDIILLREISFFIEDYFKELKTLISQKIIYMFSFFYLYFLVDYEFMRSNNLSIVGQKGLFEETKILRSFFRYIFMRRNKKYLEKYLRNEDAIEVLKDNLEIPCIFGGNLDFDDKLVLKRIFRKYNIDEIDLHKLEKMDLEEFIIDVVEEIGDNEGDIADDIIKDFKEFKEKEQIIYLTFAVKKRLDLTLRNILNMPVPSSIFRPKNEDMNSILSDYEKDDIFTCFEEQTISRMIDSSN